MEELECEICKQKKYYFSLFWDLMLAPKSKKAQKVQLEEMFDNFKAQKNDICSCGNEEASSKKLISKLPNILIISFERFKVSGERLKKANYEVNYPLVLDLKDYVLNPKGKVDSSLL